MAYQEKDREKWNKILIYDFMSCEESGKDDLEECIFVKNIPWGSAQVSKFLEGLDEKQRQISHLKL